MKVLRWVVFAILICAVVASGFEDDLGIASWETDSDAEEDYDDDWNPADEDIFDSNGDLHEDFLSDCEQGWGKRLFKKAKDFVKRKVLGKKVWKCPADKKEAFATCKTGCREEGPISTTSTPVPAATTAPVVTTAPATPTASPSVADDDDDEEDAFVFDFDGDDDEGKKECIDECGRTNGCAKKHISLKEKIKKTWRKNKGKWGRKLKKAIKNAIAKRKASPSPSPSPAATVADFENSMSDLASDSTSESETDQDSSEEEEEEEASESDWESEDEGSDFEADSDEEVNQSESEEEEEA